MWADDLFLSSDGLPRVSSRASVSGWHHPDHDYRQPLYLDYPHGHELENVLASFTFDPDELVTAGKLQSDLDDLRFTFSRSSGPGGQNVNKVNTRVTLLFDLQATTTMSAEQVTRVRRQLPTRIDKSGILRVISSRHRTQRANRQATVERLAELLREVLRIRRVRKKTRPSRAAKLRRVDQKKKRSEKKQRRRYR